MSRRRRDSLTSTLASAGVALLFHGAVLGALGVVGIDLLDKRPGKGEAQAAIDDPDLESSCGGDALLVAAARTTLCLAPWADDDFDRCWQGLATQARFDLDECKNRNEPPAEFALLTPRAAARLTPIDPEPLLEEAKLLPETPPPPPPPPQVAAAQPPPPPPPPPPAPTKQAQVVEIAKPTTEQVPDNARLLAEHDAKVERQTVARGSRFEDLVAKSKPEALTPKQAPKEASIRPETLDRDPGADKKAPDAPGKLAMRVPGAPVLAPSAQEAKTRGALGGLDAPAGDGSIARKGQGSIAQDRQDPSTVKAGEGGAGGGTPKVPNIRPTDEVLERAIGGGSVDHLEDIQEGDETALSAKRWVYAGFFNRIKRQVAQNWEPAGVWRRKDPTGTVYGFKSRITEVRVSLAPTGELTKVTVIAPSGVVELDEEAMRAFRAAAPFPNPPEGLVEKGSGLITFEFAFHFEIGKPSTSWRYLRRDR
jgi:TonB family protein